MAYQQRGLNESQEQNQHHIIRDTRPLSQRIVDTMKNPRAMSFFLLGCAIVSVLFGYLSEVALGVGVFSFIFCVTRKTTLPFRMPKTSKRKDHNDINVSTKKPSNARGIY